MKKIFVLLLAVAMIFTMVPSISMSFAWAEDSAENQEAVVSAGEDTETTLDEGSESADSDILDSNKRKDGDSIPFDDPDTEDESQDFNLSGEITVNDPEKSSDVQEDAEVIDDNLSQEQSSDSKAEAQDAAGVVSSEPMEKKADDKETKHVRGKDNQYAIDVSGIATTNSFNQNIALLEGVTVSPDTYADGDEEKHVLIRVKSATPSNTASEFDSSQDYDAEHSILNVKNVDSQGHTRAQVTYTVVYEAYVGDDILAEETISILFFDDSLVGPRVSDDVAYISKAELLDTIDGTVPFDNQEGPGYDKGDRNKIVRSFDSVTSTLSITNAVYGDSDYAKYIDGYVGFEFVLEGDYQKVEFDETKMPWLETKNADYKTFEVEKNGKTYQVMRGKFLWESAEAGQPAIGAANLQLSVSYSVLGMKNGDEIQPDFTFWMEYNDVPDKDKEIDEISADDYQFVKDYITECDVHDRVEPVNIKGDKIRVSAAPWYNIFLVFGSPENDRLGYWDLVSGQYSSATETDTSIYGRLFSIGATLEIRRPDGTGIKGCELPDGNDITFSINLGNWRYRGESTGNNYGDDRLIPILWSCEGNSDAPTQMDGRVIPTPKKYITTVPFNKGPEYWNSCYDGGIWNTEQDKNVINVTINDYKLNLDLSTIPYNQSYSTKDSYKYYSKDAKSVSEVKELCFSAGEFWFVQPYYLYDITTDDNGNVESVTKGKNVAEACGEAGVFMGQIYDRNLRVTSESGQSLAEVTDNSNQSIKTDDLLNISVVLEKPGTIGTGTGYVEYGRSHYADYNDPLTPGCGSNGKDWVMVGGKLTMSSYLDHTQGDELYMGVAYDQFLKFDDRFFDLEKVRSTYAGGTAYRGVRILYAAKPDKTGWNHMGLEPDEDGYDQEMKETEADDLIYFSSLEGLKSAGYTCVGVLEEIRGVKGEPNQNTAAYLELDGTAISDQSNVNYVFMETIESHAWFKKDVNAEIREYYGVDEITDAQYYEYMMNEFPSKLGNGEGSVVKYSEYPQASWDKQYSNTPGLRSYEKVAYHPDGSVTGSAGNAHGDSCLVIGVTTSIDINCAQSNHKNEEKTAYDMDTGQRVVDYVVQPSLSIAKPSESSTGTVYSEYTTQVTIDIDLPEKLTYIPESSYLGGTYEQTREGRQGNVIGGTPLETIVINNPDGTTTLRYVYEVTVDWTEIEGDTAYLDPIYFSCDIGEAGSDNDVVNNEQLMVTAQIESTDDNTRDKAVADGNKAEQGIIISKGAALSLADFAKQVAVDTGDDVSFTSRVVNDSNQPRPNAATVVHIPMDGYNGTHYHGERTIKEFTVPASGYTVWYSTETEAYDRDDHTASEVTSGWTQLTVNADGTVDFTGVDTSTITAIAVVGDIPGNASVDIKTTLSIPGDEAGDYFAHSVSLDGLSSYARSFVVKRSIRGLAWVDKNADGLQTSSELSNNVVAPITVTLLKLKDGETDTGDISNYEVFRDKDGEDATVALGKSLDLNSSELGNMSGYQYDFTNMPQGTYAVRFNNSDSTIAARYRVTDKDVNGNANDDIDSDASYVNRRSKKVWGVVDGSYITGIEMPEAEAITTSHYVSRYNDLGITVMTYDLEIGKEVETLSGSTAQADPDKEFTFTVNVKEESDSALAPYAGKYTLVKADGSTENKTTSDGEIKLKADERALIEDLEINAEYSVKETASAEADGYIYDTSETTGTLTSDLTGDKAIIKNNQFKTAEIPVSKTWSGYNGSDVYTATVTLSAKVDGDTYTLPEGIETTHTFTSPDEGTYTFEDLPSKTPDGKDIVYTADETGVNTDGKTVSVKDGEYYIYSTVAEETVDGGTAYRILGKWTPAKTTEDGTTVFTNTWTPANTVEEGTAGFTIRKVDEEGNLVTTGTAVFLVQKKGEGDTLTDVGRYSTVNGVATIADLTEGEYVITEKTAPEGYLASEETYELSVTKTLKLKSVTESTLTNLFQRLFSWLGGQGTDYSWDGERLTLTVANKLDLTDAEFYKNWVNADGTRTAPDGAEVTFTLYANGDPTEKTITLDGTVDGNGEDEAWKATFKDLTKYKKVNDELVEIEYTVKETVTCPGYEPERDTAADGKAIINKQIETEKAFDKSWYSADGSTEPPEGATVTFALHADNQATDMTITLDGTADENGEDEAWKAVFKHLPKYKVVDGEAVEIEYTIEELGTYHGYDAVMDADGNGITNKQRETEAAFMKEWKNADGTTEAPEGAIVTYELYADGEATGITVDLDGTEDEEAPKVTGGYERKPWLASFEHLPMFRIGEYNGNPALYNIEYTVKETVTYPGYEPERDTAADGKTIINKQVETKVEATKEWYNADGTTEPANGLRVTYTLYADGEATGYSETLFGIPDEEAPEVTGGYESEAWKASFIHLPKYKVVDGRAVEIEYTVIETKTYPGYESIKTETGYLNKQIETEIEATKEWQNADGTTEAPEGATVTYELLQDGTATGIKVVLDGTADEEAPEATGGYESEAWVASFRHLPKYIVRYGNGVAFLNEIEYTTEETVTYPGYETIKTETGYLNKEIETEAEATKVWINADGTKEAPENGYAEFTLYADGEDTGYTVRLTGEAGKAPEATGGYESEEWKASFVHLPKYKLADGEAEEIEYTVRETGVYKGYEAENEEANEDGAIVNRQITVDVEGTKIWDDNEDQDGMRPESITVRLYADGEEIDSVEVTEEDDWDYSFTNLPKYAGEEEIEYTVKEDHVKGYEATYDGYDITNYHEPGTTEVSGEKIWDDEDDKDGIRPDSITVELYADGEKIDEKEVTSDDDWEFAFTNLEKMKDGEEIDYTIDEVEVEDYTTSIDGYTITNSHTPEDDPVKPPTGDTTNVVPYACGLGAGLLGLIALLLRKRRGSNK